MTRPTSPTGPGAVATPLRAVALALYALVVLYLLAPVVLTSVGADDQVWILRYPALSDGSALHAYWAQIHQALEFKVQDRSTALAFAERSALAVLVMNLAVTFAVPPMVLWAVTKLVLIGLTVVAGRVLLQTVRFRAPDGEVRGLSRETVGYVTLALPLVIAIGVKAQNLGGFNGWTFYPTLCLGLFPSIVLVTVVAMRLNDALQRHYARLVAPVVVLFALWGVVVAFSFELLVVAVPTVGLAMLLHPRPVEGSLVRRWRAPVTVAGAFGLSWLAVFAAIKAVIGSRDCTKTNSCYSGTVVEVHPGTILNNFGASLPIGTSAKVTEEAKRAGVPFPGVSASSVLVGLIAIVLLVALVVLQQRRYAARPDADRDPGTSGETKGLITVAVLCAFVAVASALITGITERAVQSISDLRTAYHVGPVVWTAIAIIVLVALRALWLSRLPALGLGTTVLAGVLAVAVVAVMVPRNHLSAQINSRDAVFADFLHREVALGQRGKDADERRCTELKQDLALEEQPLRPAVQRLLVGAYGSFKHYHGRPFCRSMPIRELLRS